MKAKNQQVSFEKNTILTSEMLNIAADFPRELIYYLNYSCRDGFISGFEISNRENKNGRWALTISPGVIKYQDRLYYMGQTMEIDSELNSLEDNRTYYCYFCETEKTDNIVNVQTRQLEFYIVTDYPEDKNIIMFCQICPHTNGLRLPSSLGELKDELSVDLSQCMYAGKTGRCFHPYITHLIKQELFRKKDKTPEEYMLLGCICSNYVLPFDMLYLLYSEEADGNPAQLLENIIDMTAKRNNYYTDEETDYNSNSAEDEEYEDIDDGPMLL